MATTKQVPTKVTALLMKNVYDKELRYVKVENEFGSVIISVGEKTYNGVKNLTEGKEPKTILGNEKQD